MVFNKEFYTSLTLQAKASPRLRVNYDLRDTVEDGSQRMLNAIEPGTEIPIHRHPTTSEDIIILFGRAEEVFFDGEGRESERFLLVPGGMDPASVPAVHVPKGQYHTCRSLESGTIIMEFKNGGYCPEGTEALLK